MSSMVEAVFIVSGHIVGYMGGTLAILLVALVPLYVYGYFSYREKLNFRTSKPALFGFIAAFSLSILLAIIFSITAIVLGAWG